MRYESYNMKMAEPRERFDTNMVEWIMMTSD